MKHTKKLFAIALTLIMALALSVPAFAASITINNAVDKQTYDAYKIFDVTYADTNSDGTNDTWSYSISTDSPWYTDVKAYADDEANGLTLTVAASDETVWMVTDTTGFSAPDFAEYLNDHLTGKTADASAAAEGTTATITGLSDAGYYFVNSSLGALCILNTADDIVTVQEKNTEPTIAKEVQEDSTSEWGAENTAAIGETVEFKITVTAGIGAADTDWVITDTADAGFDAPANFVLTIGSATPAQGADTWNVAIDGNDFEVTIYEALAETMEEGDTAVITYDAMLNADADTGDGDEDGNKNVAILTYGATSTTEVETITYTYEFDLVKTDSSNTVITGAEFKLYDAETGGNEIALILDEGSYRPVLDGEEGVVIAVGTANIRGLDIDDTCQYWLEETLAPDGYNLLAARKDVELTANNNATLETSGEGDAAVTTYVEGGVQVINESGALLPSTGGIGTTIFYVVGALLMAGAGVLLVTKKRMADEE